MRTGGSKLNNKGFSLVELVISVTILAIIISPLIRGLYTSANLTAKGRNVRDMTLSAQNVAEALQSEDLDSLITEIKDDPEGNLTLRGIDGASADIRLYQKDDDDNYVLVSNSSLPDGFIEEKEYNIGIKGVTAGSGTYDAMICLNADESGYNNINDKKIVTYTPIENVYSQPSGEDNPDILAARYFADMASLASGENVSISTILKSYQDRIMTIHIEKDTNMLNARVETEYSMDYLGESYYQDTSTEFYRGDYDEDNPTSLYIFYYPSYANTHKSTPADSIRIVNQDNLKVKVFLAKQDISGEAYDYDAGYSTLDSIYNASLSVYEKYDGSRTMNTSVFSNLNENIYSSEEMKISSVDLYSYKGNFVSKLVVSGDLVSTEQKNRIYSITVDLYEPDSSFDQDKLICTYDSAKLR